MYKSLLQNKKAVIFDLDGTITDTEYFWAKAIVNIADENYGFVEYNIAETAGLELTDRWEHILLKRQIEPKIPYSDLVKMTITRFVQYITEAETIKTLPGFWSLATELKLKKNIKIGLTTNTRKELVNTILDKIGLSEFFDAVVTLDDAKKPKPDPEMYHICLKELGISSKECLVFEDSYFGAQASAKANIQTVVIWDALIDKKSYPEEVIGFIPDFEGLAGNLDKNLEEVLLDQVKEVLDQPAQEE